jgi:hydrogenase-4 component F
MAAIALLLLAVPLAASLASVLLSPRAAAAVTAGSGVASFGLVLALVPGISHRDLDAFGFVRVDALSAVFLIATSFLYGCVALYSIGYLAVLAKGGNPLSTPDRAADSRYARRFWVGLNLFAWSMLAAPMMSNLALLWIMVEITTIVSALLVSMEDTDGAAEAAWKYVLIASAGLAIALLGTIFLYYAGSRLLGPSYSLAFSPLLVIAVKLPHTVIRLAFVLAVLGYGTKVGLFPVHTWLPDAHSEAPTPVSALLSGSLLAVSFYAILRFYQIAAGTLGPGFPKSVLLVFGVLSLLIAALYLLDQRDYKRMLAYSSVEHMGILAIGVSFGAPVALFGVLLHVLAHAAAKGNAFMGAGVIAAKFGTKQIESVTGGLDLLPWSGPFFLAAVLALSAMPPFGIFRSEFEIVAGGLAASRNAPAVILVAAVTIAFLGLSMAANRMLLTPRRDLDADPAGAALTRGEPSVLMVVPVAAGLIALLILGLHPPGELIGLLDRAVTMLRGPA